MDSQWGEAMIVTDRYSAYVHVPLTGATTTTYIVVVRDNITDAVASNRPANTSSAPNAEGKVDFFEQADSEKQSHWKRKLGQFVYEHVLRPEFEAGTGETLQRPDHVIIIDFPANYQLYVHKTGDRHVPRGDAYLYGSRYVNVFRSPEEFAPHLKWLLNGSPMTSYRTRDCRCKYCDPTRTQTEISAELHRKKKKDGDGDRKGGRKPKDGKDGKKKPKTSSLSTDIPFKDYTKLNSPA